MTKPDRTPEPMVGRISVPKSYEVLADKLRQTILDGSLKEGMRLPTERELVSQSGLSRGSVREALRKLEVEGLVKTKLGRSGGNIVSKPGPESMAHVITQFVRGRRLSLRSLQETREALEPGIARLAAEHRTAAEVARLRELNAEMADAIDDSSRFAAVNVAWHTAVATASHNDLLVAFLFSISDDVLVVTISEEYDTPDLRREVLKAHERIIVAIEAGDGDAAFRRMQRHVQATRARTRAREASEESEA
ncbi:GntR family transcriptional regulator [Azorhizobium oxalatiphilum]|uniref:GntR family transcriptional regulator n=1 Tax=Azorhizobium oxalatiphilum TaxID=980631 RepID=A0A917F696_9HYPH|nr:FadR/GntR family transcriptional regulator [Azorhizobium oxalatiphilum]GGF53526.1 GntR family transcriptional regulator [Azorhizobium oxalatiphilum]